MALAQLGMASGRCQLVGDEAGYWGGSPGGTANFSHVSPMRWPGSRGGGRPGWDATCQRLVCQGMVCQQDGTPVDKMPAAFASAKTFDAAATSAPLQRIMAQGLHDRAGRRGMQDQHGSEVC